MVWLPHVCFPGILLAAFCSLQAPDPLPGSPDSSGSPWPSLEEQRYLEVELFHGVSLQQVISMLLDTEVLPIYEAGGGLCWHEPPLSPSGIIHCSASVLDDKSLMLALTVEHPGAAGAAICCQQAPVCSRSESCFQPSLVCVSLFAYRRGWV